MENERPRNPFRNDAITIFDLRPGTPFAVYKAGEIVLRGTVIERHEADVTGYTDDGWTDIPAIVDGQETLVDPYAHGFICHRWNGEWEPDTFVLKDELPEAA